MKMKDFFFLKVWAKNGGMHHTPECIIHGKIQYSSFRVFLFFSWSKLCFILPSLST